MNTCSRCQAELCYEHVPQNRAYQCSACRQINVQQGANEESFACRTSHRSFWLGLSIWGIALLFAVLLYTNHPWLAGFLGIPAMIVGGLAMYFGVKAILRSKYEPISARSKLAAVVGSLSGSCLGMLVGGLVAVFFCASIVVAWLTIDTDNPTEVERMVVAIADFELPTDVEWFFGYAHQSPVTNRLEVWDDSKFLPSEHRFYILWMNSLYTSQWGSTEMNRNNMRQRGLSKIMGGTLGDVERKQDPDELSWTVCGTETVVSRAQWIGEKLDKGESVMLDYVTYQCLFDANNKTFCLTFISENPPEQKIDESEIRKLFESFSPK